MPGVRRSGKRRGAVDLMRAVNRINGAILASGKSPLLDAPALVALPPGAVADALASASTRVDAPALVGHPNPVALPPGAVVAAPVVVESLAFANASLAELPSGAVAEDAAVPPVLAAAVPVLPAANE